MARQNNVILLQPFPGNCPVTMKTRIAYIIMKLTALLVITLPFLVCGCANVQWSGPDRASWNLSELQRLQQRSTSEQILRGLGLGCR